MTTVEKLKEKVVSRVVRNVRRGNADEESSRGMYREEIRLDLQRSRFFTESFKEAHGQAMVLRRAKALANLLAKMGIFIRDHERIVGYQTSDINGIYHPIDQNWKSLKWPIKMRTDRENLSKSQCSTAFRKNNRQSSGNDYKL